MKTIFSALFAGAAMLLLAGCLSVETVPAAETAPAAPAGNAVENPVKKEAEKAAPARPSRGAAEEEAIRFAGPGRNPVVVFDAGFSSKPADPECGGAMKQLADAGMTMVVVTHEMSFAREVSSRVVFMADGQIREDRPARELFADPHDDRLKDFLSKVLNL